MNIKLKIRNSTAEFLIFTANTWENSIEVRFEDEKYLAYTKNDVSFIWCFNSYNKWTFKKYF